MVEKRDETRIDPQFFLPPSVYDIRYSEKDTAGSGEENATEFSQQGETSADSVMSPAPSDSIAGSELPIPDSITIVSQNVKAAAGGGYLVDLIIEIPDMHGVENYDVAVTKA